MLTAGIWPYRLIARPASAAEWRQQSVVFRQRRQFAMAREQLLEGGVSLARATPLPRSPALVARQDRAATSPGMASRKSP